MKPRESSVVYLGNEISTQVNSSQCDWELERESERGSTSCQGVSSTVQKYLTVEIISTYVCEVFVPYFSNFVKACVQIACFPWKYWNSGHLREHLLTINRPREANTQQAGWHL